MVSVAKFRVGGLQARFADGQFVFEKAQGFGELLLVEQRLSCQFISYPALVLCSDGSFSASSTADLQDSSAPGYFCTFSRFRHSFWRLK